MLFPVAALKKHWPGSHHHTSHTIGDDALQDVRSLTRQHSAGDQSVLYRSHTDPNRCEDGDQLPTASSQGPRAKSQELRVKIDRLHIYVGSINLGGMA